MRLNAQDSEITWGLQAIQHYRAKPEGLMSLSASFLCVSTLYRVAAAALRAVQFDSLPNPCKSPAACYT